CSIRRELINGATAGIGHEQIVCAVKGEAHRPAQPRGKSTFYSGRSELIDGTVRKIDIVGSFKQVAVAVERQSKGVISAASIERAFVSSWRNFINTRGFYVRYKQIAGLVNGQPGRIQPGGKRTHTPSRREFVEETRVCKMRPEIALIQIPLGVKGQPLGH